MLHSLSLKQFRSHVDFNNTFSPHVNVIIGRNGSGKTNILEAIYFISQGKSFRTNNESLINHHHNKAKITTQTSDHTRQVNLEKNHDADTLKKQFKINATTFSRLSFSKTTPLVLFEPSFMQIISRGPDQRRDYFDTVISQADPTYQATLNTYRRTLAQRNSLLKQASTPSDQLFVWDVRLAELGAVLARHRHALVQTINKTLTNTYSHIAGAPHKATIAYQTSCQLSDYAGSMAKALRKNATKDKQRGFTSIGPHRDDYLFFINHQLASEQASRGENRTLLLAMKIIEADIIKRSRQKNPLFLLDDVFSELDDVRQTKLVEYFTSHQVFITTTTITPLIKGISGKLFEI